MKDQATLRREGMADACVLLVAGRVVPQKDLTEWGDHLGLTQRELIEAIDRWKAEQHRLAGISQVTKRKNPTKREPQNLPCPHCPKVCMDERARKAHIRTVHVKVECPDCGRICTAGGLGPHRAARHRPVAA